MNIPQNEMDLERLARKHASAKMSWYIHAGIYIAVNLLLLLLSALGARQWAIFPALGWGLGLAIHGLAVLWVTRGFDLRERLMQRERQRLAQRKPR